MKTLPNSQLLSRTNEGTQVSLIFACAWCPGTIRPAADRDTDTVPSLQKSSVITHGICAEHKAQLLRQIRQR